MRYKGKYRLRTPICERTNNFPREYNGQLAENDVYIDCQNKVTISSYGHGILEVYIPSLGRGRNIVKAIKHAFQDENIILKLVETDEEVIFQFHAKYMEQLEPYLKPKTNGADRSPFSTKNLPKTKYNIPDEELVAYKEIVQKIGKNRIIELVHITNDYLKSLTNKKYTFDDLKADMALKGLKGKEYIHNIGKWDDYIKYLQREI